VKKLAIGNGKYMKDGVEKTRWINVGVIGVGSNGKEYMMIDPTINFAAFHRDEGRDMVMVSIFDDSQQQGGQQNQQQQGGYNQQAPQQQQAYSPPPTQYEQQQQNGSYQQTPPPQQLGQR